MRKPYVKVEFTVAMDPIVISSLSDLIRQYDRCYKANDTIREPNQLIKLRDAGLPGYGFRLELELARIT